jgi:hypothetical protein
MLSVSSKAIESDLDCVMDFGNGTPITSPTAKASFALHGTTTVYGRAWLNVIIDEFHRFRNLNRGYWSLVAIRERSDNVVGMTATPATTRTMVSRAFSSLSIHLSIS